MKKAVFNRFVIIILISFFLCSSVFLYFFRLFFYEQIEYNMTYSLYFIDYSLDYDKDIQTQINEINPIVLGDASRITIVDIKGNVIADTSNYIDYKDNHKNRKEIKDAINGGTGFSVRFSETLHKNLLYAASQSNKSNYIIRLSIPYNGVFSFFKSIVPAIILCIIAAFIAAFLTAGRFANTVTKPLMDISRQLLKIQKNKSKVEFNDYKYNEINNIVSAVKILSSRVDENVKRLEYEKNKTNYIFDNMTEGLILLDKYKNIVSINKAALKILGCDKIKKEKNIIYYTQEMNIINAVTNAAENDKDTIFDINDFSDNIFSVHVSRTKENLIEGSTGVIILIVDVTIDRKNQLIRQEFFSNASHELKTPITAIQGYAELLNSDLDYTDEQKRAFIERIINSAKNMASLINDILMISRLETKTVNDNKSSIFLNDLINEIIGETEPLRKDNNVTVYFETSENITINADINKIRQLLSNLISNALKYNKVNGIVRVSAEKKNGILCIEITDTGIGIPEDSQQRIFERFYRVDSGRDKKRGGTGLGLSIVKHIVNFYGGNIKLESKVNAGTKISISIPCEED